MGKKVKKKQKLKKRAGKKKKRTKKPYLVSKLFKVEGTAVKRLR